MKHLLKFSQLPADEKTVGGSRRKATKKNFPVLQGMSLYKLVLEAKGIREPHWHANADELGVCLKGSVLVNLYHTNNVKDSVFIEEGDVFLIPSGALHDIENLENTQSELILTFSNEDVEDFHLSSTMGMFTDAVLGNTWNVEKKVFQGLKRSLNYSFATLASEIPTITDQAYYPSPFRYHLKASEPIIANESGQVRVARQDVWPILKRQALYSLKLTKTGMREPHWHPETAELGFVKSGKGRMSILSPNGDVDTYIMETGDIYFIPKAYPHHIENLDNKNPLELLIFFDQAMPEDIGFTGSVKSFSDETLGSIMGVKPIFFEQLPKIYQDLFIVNKINPVD